VHKLAADVLAETASSAHPLPDFTTSPDEMPSSVPAPAVYDVRDRPLTPAEKERVWFVIGASSVGTIIEWYDFYIFGTLATIIAAKFYPSGNELVAFLKTLATFAVGFAVRPFGASATWWAASTPSCSRC
jgi:hypothetical protein